MRGSILGTRKDLAEAIRFAAKGKVKAHFDTRRVEDINGVFADLRDGEVDGCIVPALSACPPQPGAALACHRSVIEIGSSAI